MKMAENQIMFYLIKFFFISNFLFNQIIAYKGDFDVKYGKKICLPMKNFMQLTYPKNELKINGFRAESPKHPITVDENGLTVIPDKSVITLRLFGTDFSSVNNQNIRIGFTTSDGQTGDPCDPDREFTAKQIVNNNMALVDITLSETISDKPYYICCAFDAIETNRYITDSKKSLILTKSLRFTYLSTDDSLKIRVIGRNLSVKSGSDERDANLKTKLALIIDETNKIHRIVDEMQEW